jgi:hypothetical protein
VRVTNRPWRQSAFTVGATTGPQCCVPILDVCRPQLLNHLRADVRHDLIFDKFAIKGGRASADITGAFPPVNAVPHVLGNRDLARLNIFFLRAAISSASLVCACRLLPRNVTRVSV